MDVSIEPFDDRSEPNADGSYEYIYVGAAYAFTEGGQRLVFRRYDDQPAVADLVDPIHWRPDVSASSLFREATAYLRDHLGVTCVLVLDPTPPGRGFVPLAEAIGLMRRRTRRRAWIALVAAILVAAYSWAGVAMTASFAVASPERAHGHRIATGIYLAILAASLLVAIVATLVLWRARRPSDAAAT